MITPYLMNLGMGGSPVAAGAPTIYYSCLIPDSGELLMIFPQMSETSGGGFDQLIGVTSVAGTPTLKKNGTPISIGPVTWDEGQSNYGGPGTAVSFLLTGGPVLSSDVLTVDIPANFVNGSAPAYTAVPVANATGGGLEPAFGVGVISGATGCPGLNVTPTAKFASDSGGGSIDPTTPNYLLWNQFYRSNGFEYAPGSSGPSTFDERHNLLTWTPGTVRISCCNISASQAGINSRGAPNLPGKWGVVVDDLGPTFSGGLASTFAIHEVSGNGTATFVPGESSVVGTTHTIVYDIQYASSNPSDWTLEIWLYITSPANNTGGSDGLSHWAYGTPGTSNYIFASPPNMADGSALAVDRSEPFAISPNVRAQLTSGGHTVEHIRQMESFGGDGLNNRIYACDLPMIDGIWQNPRTIGPITFNFVRHLNTDPAKGSGGDNTYGWPASTRVYGPQADFCLSDGVTTAITATLTAGNRGITITAGTPLLAGGIITGTGIPTGTRLASFDNSAGTGWLEFPATVSGSQSLTLHNPGYLNIAPGDNGAFQVQGFGGEQNGVGELRSAVPHGLTTGYFPGGDVANTSNGNNLVFTDVGSFASTGTFRPLFVTGPYTIAVSWYVNGVTPPGPQTIVPATEYDFTATGGYQFGVQIPYSKNKTFAYEAQAGLTASLGCNACYYTLPIWGTDSLYSAIGKMAHDYSNPATIQRLEVADEPWNGFNTFAINLFGRLARQNLYGYQTAGTVISEYFTADGFALPFSEFAIAQGVLLTGHAGAVFKAAYVAAGGDASKVELIAGSKYNGASVTQQTSGTAQLYGVPIRWVVIAPYTNTPFSASIEAAFSSAGGAWPLGAINDYARLYHAYHYYEQLFLATHAAIFATWGEPIEPCHVVDAGSHGGSFAGGGGFRFWYTYLDHLGNETTVGQSDSGSFSIGSGNSPGFTMPRTLSWVVSINLYLGASDWVPAQSFFYKNLTVAGNPAGSEIILTDAYDSSSTDHPPTVNGVTDPAVIGTPPGRAAYEGGQVQIVPTAGALTTPYLGQPEWMALTHDALAHPSVRLDIPTMMAAAGTGCQWQPGSGLAWYTHFQTWNYPGPNDLATFDYNEYLAYAGIGQVPGAGTSNQYAIRGAPGDGVDHNGGAPLSSGFNGVAVANQSPRGQGILDWLAGSPTPTPTPTVVSTSPANGATGVSTASPVSITYSEAMDSTTLTLTLSAASVPFTGYNSGTMTATFTPASSLSASTTYAAVAAGSSAAEVSLATPYSWSFTTAAPAVPARRWLPSLR